MNDLFYGLGIESWKSTLSALMMPPLPLLVLVLLGAYRVARRRAFGGALLAAGCAALWLSTTPAAVDGLADWLAPSPPALDAAALARLQRETGTATAIVVVGGGRRESALEYGGAASPGRYTIERLRYGLWLARRTGLPVAYTGGIAHGGRSGESEAAVAQRVARDEFGVPLRWAEDRSRDTSENARYTVAMLRDAGIRRIVLVTHGFHMRRVLRAFARAAAGGAPMALVPAPIGIDPDGPLTWTDWLPNADAMSSLRVLVHEWLGWLAGA